MFHARISNQLAAASAQIFGEPPVVDARAYQLRNGCHILQSDPDNAFERFCAAAPAVINEIEASLADLASELTHLLSRRHSTILTAVREGVWIVGYAGELMADCRTTSAHGGLVVATPGYALVKNIGSEILTYQRIGFEQPLELMAQLNLESAASATLAPGECLTINGFDELITWTTAGALIAVLSTLPRAAYESVFSLPTGARVGQIASELRSSSLALALRMFAAAGWSGAEPLSKSAAESCLRELRWAALNYDWQTDSPLLHDSLSQFAHDDDDQIRNLAQVCLEMLERENGAQGVDA